MSRNAWLPSDIPDPEAWVEQNIYFSGQEAAVAGYWSHLRFPYSRAILQAFVDPSIERIVLNWGTQLGKTTLLGACLCYMAATNPGPTMVACANGPDAKKHFLTKLQPMLEACEVVARKLPPRRLRSIEHLDLGDMAVLYAWSGSKATLSGSTIRNLFVNEINLWSSAKSREGDPLRMVRDRTKAFPNRKIFIEGKPTITGQCRITEEYEETDQRKYHVPCPLCGAYQSLQFGTEHSEGGLKWNRAPDGSSDPAVARMTAYYQCAFCKGRIGEEHKLLMLRRGVWLRKGEQITADGEISGEPIRKGNRAGFQMNSLYSSVLSWGEFAEEFLGARAGSMLDLQAFWNGWMALAFDVPGRRIRGSEIQEHAVDYDPGCVPDSPLLVVCTVDVQEASLWYVVRAWGYGGDSWLVRYGQIPDFATLNRILEDSYQTTEGPRRVEFVMVDSGYRANDVYDYCMTRQYTVPIKGDAQYRLPSMVKISKVPGRDKLPLWMIDAGQAFDQLFDRRLRIKPGDPGYWALHNQTDHDYFRSLEAWERREELDKWSRPVMRWVSTDREWEHLADCEKMQEAAAFIFQFSLKQRPPRKVSNEQGKEKASESESIAIHPIASGRRDGRGWFER